MGHSGDAPKTLRGGVTPHELTVEERRRGAEVTNQKRREQKERAQRIADERLADALTPAFDRIDATIADDEEKALALRAALAVVEHNIGRPTQREEVSGPDGGPIEVTDARELLERRIAGIADRRREGGGA